MDNFNDGLVEIICHTYASDFMDPDIDIENIGAGLNLWCLDRNSIPVHLILRDSPIYCYVELPKTLHGSPHIWNDADIKMLEMNWKKVHSKAAPTELDLTERQKIYYYKGDDPQKSKDQMVRAHFSSAKMMNIFGYRVKKLTEYPDFGILSFSFFEDKIIVRRKVFTIQDTEYSQWFRIKGYEIPFDSDDRQAVKGRKGIREFLVEDYTTMTPISPEESSGWVTSPSSISFDIETYTKNHYALPNVDDPNDVVYMISAIYQVYNKPETRERYVIVMGVCNDIEGVTVIRVDDEEDVIIQFMKLVEELDPEILMGYNIFNYDYPYIVGRQAQFMKNWYPCSRLEGYVSNDPVYDMKWKSSGYKENRICYLNLPGRISIDMMAFIKREYPNLDKHSLDFVSNNFLGVGKHDVPAIRMFKAFESQDVEEMTIVTKYCVQDAELVTNLFDKLNVWIGLVEMSNIVGVEIMELSTRGQQPRCLSQIYDLTAKLGIVINSREMPKIPYEGGFVGDPIVGIHDGVICLDFSSLYPSIMMAYNICYTTLVSPAIARFISDDMCNIIKIDEKTTYRFVKKEIFEGILPRLVAKLVKSRKAVRAKMGEIKKQLGIHEDGSVIPTNLPKDVRQTLELTLKVLDKRQNGLKISANSMYGFLGVQEGGKLPLIEGASAITSWGRQLINEVNNRLKREYGAIVVYNDTDSSMVKIPGVDDPLECYKMGIEISEKISGRLQKILPDGTILPALEPWFPPPLKMEFEKAMRIFCIAKKMYAYYSIGEDGKFVIDNKTGLKKITAKGIAIARRDKFGYMKKVYTELLRAILDMRPIDEAFDIIMKAVYELLYADIPVKGNFTIIRGLGSEYKGNYFMKVFADELARMGHPIQPGDRVEYVIVKDTTNSDGSKTGLPLGRRLRLLEMYEESQKHDDNIPRPATMYPKEEIDREYYVIKGLKNPIDQLFSLGYSDVFRGTKLGRQGYQPESRLKFASVKYPIKMIEKILGDHRRRDVDPKETEDFIKYGITDWFNEEVDKALTELSDENVEDDINEEEEPEEDDGFDGVEPDYDYDFD